jgi:hypothetical protein
MEGLDVKEDLTITEWPYQNNGQVDMGYKEPDFTMCKVQWSNHAEDEATWEREEELRAEYPQLCDPSESRGRYSS